MNWKIILKSLKNADMKKRIFAVLGMLLVFRMLAHLPIPLSNPETLKQVLENAYNAAKTSQLASFINVLSGGALANFSIMLIGLGPFINASIIMQLLTRAIPKLENMQKDGEYGRKKINQYTRIIAFPLAVMQSIGMIFLVKQNIGSFSGMGDITAGASILDWVLMVAALTGGSMILMWLGELITEKGVGNGISLLITVGIVSTMPRTISQMINLMFDGESKMNFFGKTLPINSRALFYNTIVIIAVIIITFIVVKLNEASRKLTITYAKRVQGSRAYGGVTTYLPIKLITAGVVPIIFAVTFMSLPQFVGNFLVNADSLKWQDWGTKLTLWFQKPSYQTFLQNGFTPYIYPILYFLLVVVFTYFYTSITFNTKELSEELQKDGGFLGDVRAGKQTEKYLSRVVNRLTLFGSLSLGLLAITPIVAQAMLPAAYSQIDVAIGGTSVLILVSVALETLRAVESRALMVTYDHYAEPDYFSMKEMEKEEGKKSKLSKFLPRRKASTKKKSKKTK